MFKMISYVDVPYSFSYKDISVRLYNTCGPSQWYTERFYPFEGYYLAFSPNPSIGETNITIESYSEDGFYETAQWDLEVYSETQLLKTKQTSLRGQSTRIQTAGWKEGVYLVRVNYKDEVLTGKLMVKE